MIGRNFIVKNREIFSEHNAKNFAQKFLTITKKLSKKTKWFRSVMTMFIHSQNPINFAWI